jgi:hypothetical protein
MGELGGGEDGASFEGAADFSAERSRKGHTVEHALEGLRKKDSDSYTLRDGHAIVQAAISERLAKPSEHGEKSAKRLQELDKTLSKLESGDTENLDYETTKELREYFRVGKEKWGRLIGPQVILTRSLDPIVVKNYDAYEAILKDIDHHLPTTPEHAYPLQPYEFPDIEALAALLPKAKMLGGKPTLEHAAAVFGVLADDITTKKTTAESDPRFRAQQLAIKKLYERHEGELSNGENAVSVIVTPDYNGEEDKIETAVYDGKGPQPKPPEREGSYHFIYDGTEDIPYAEGIMELNGPNGLDTNITQAIAGIENLQKNPQVITKAQEFNIGVLLMRLAKDFASGRIDDRHQKPFDKLTAMLRNKLQSAKLIDEPANEELGSARLVPEPATI